jgi:hypothetical protein
VSLARTLVIPLLALENRRSDTTLVAGITKKYFATRATLGYRASAGKETPPFSLLRANSLTLKANYNRGCLAARSPGAAGSSLLLGSPQVPVRSFSAL